MGNGLRLCCLFVLAFAFTSFTASRIQEKPTAVLKPQFIFWNVGQGDLMTYVDSDVCWFFDLGGSHVLRFNDLMKLKTLCYGKPVSAFISHFDKDHIQFYRAVDQAVPFRQVFYSHLDAQTRTGRMMLEYFRNHGAQISVLNARGLVKSKHSSLKCVWPPRGLKKRDENSKSLVFVFRRGSSSLLLTGDFPGKLEKRLIASAGSALFNVDILKVAHHGSGTSTYMPLLNRLQPKTCMVSVGRDNKYRHPRAELLARLQEAHCAIMRTDRLGTIRWEL